MNESVKLWYQVWRDSTGPHGSPMVRVVQIETQDERLALATVHNWRAYKPELKIVEPDELTYKHPKPKRAENAARRYCVIGWTCYGFGETEAEATKNARKSGGAANVKRRLVYVVSKDTTVDDMGGFRYPACGPAPWLLRKINGKSVTDYCRTEEEDKNDNG